MKALIIIDVQNDFLPGGQLAVEDGGMIIPIINNLQAKFDLVVATQDWHPAGHKSFVTNHPGRKVFERIYLEGLEQVLWPPHCIQGTEGAAFNEKLDANRIEAIFRKGTNEEIDSYSGFYDNGKRKSTALSEYLKGRKVEQVYIVGLAADYCVYYSMKDALEEGFDTCLIEDATKAIDKNNFAAVKKDILNRGGKIISSEHLN